MRDGVREREREAEYGAMQVYYAIHFSFYRLWAVCVWNRTQIAATMPLMCKCVSFLHLELRNSPRCPFLCAAALCGARLSSSVSDSRLSKSYYISVDVVLAFFGLKLISFFSRRWISLIRQPIGRMTATKLHICRCLVWLHGKAIYIRRGLQAERSRKCKSR